MMIRYRRHFRILRRQDSHPDCRATAVWAAGRQLSTAPTPLAPLGLLGRWRKIGWRRVR